MKFMKFFAAVLLASNLLFVACQMPNPYVSDAKIAISTKSYDKAISQLEEGLKADPNLEEAAFLLGDIYSREEKRDYLKMKTYFDKALSINKIHETEIKDRIKYAFDKLRYQGITEQYNKGNEIFAQDQEKGTEALKKAKETLVLANQLVPNDFLVMSILGSIENRVGTKEDAVKYYITATESYSFLEEKGKQTYSKNLINLYLMLADMEGTQKENDEAALKYYGLALNYDANNKDAILRMAGIYQKQKNNDKAVELYNKLTEISPNDTDLLFNLGLLYLSMGDKNKSIATFEKLCSINPNDNEAKIKLAEIYFEVGKYQSVIDLLVAPYNSSFSDKDKQNANNVIFQSYIKLGNSKEGKKYFVE